MKYFKMSLFLAPISPVRDAGTGRIVKPASLKPYRSVSLRQVYEIITSNPRLRLLTEQVRRAALEDGPAAYRTLKQQTLPYVTPCGVFSYRRGSDLVEASGLIVVDIDHLDSPAEARELREALFHDPFLRPELVFISPCGRGVKAFVPYDADPSADVRLRAAESVYWAMDYVQCAYSGGAATTTDKGVDTSGKDLVRACFLSCDEEARLREGD